MILLPAIRGVLRVGVIALLAGCVQTPKSMYLWENFPRQQYDLLLRTGISPDEQIRNLQAHMEKARTNGEMLPPGFRAHLGMLFLSSGDVGEARLLWQAEKAAFPESTPYMEKLLKRLDASSTGKTPT